MPAKHNHYCYTLTEKSYKKSLNTLFDLTSSNIERSNSSSHVFQGSVSQKRAQLGHIHVCLLNTKRKPYMMSPFLLLDLTFIDLYMSSF